MSNRSIVCFFLTYFTPIVLFLLVYFTLGCYYESNDDAILTTLLNGQVGNTPNADVRPYLPGSSVVLQSLYRVNDRWPWYDLLLSAGLYLAWVQWHKVARHIFTGWYFLQRELFLIFFIFSIFIFNFFCFNFTRGPVLLGAGSVLLLTVSADQSGARRGRTWLLSGLGLLLGFITRADAWWLGAALATIPTTLLLVPQLPGRLAGRLSRIARLVAPLFGAALLLTALSQVALSPERRAYMSARAYLVKVKDYQTLYLTADNLLDNKKIKILKYWMLGDHNLVTADFFKRVGHTDYQQYMHHGLLDKLHVLKDFFIKNFIYYFIFLFFLTFFLCRYDLRLLFESLLNVLFCIGLLLSIAVLMKVPQRLLAPAVGVSVFGQMLMFGSRWQVIRPAAWRWLVAGLVLVCLGEVWSLSQLRADFLRAQQTAGRQVQELKQQFAGRKVVSNFLFFSIFEGARPFQPHDLGTVQLVPLCGWNTQEPSYNNFLHQMTGSADWAVAMQRLAQDPQAVWLIDPGFRASLDQYMRAAYNTALPLPLEPAAELPFSVPADNTAACRTYLPIGAAPLSARSASLSHQP